MDFKISSKKSVNQISWDFSQMYVISKKKTMAWGMDLKSSKIYSLAYGFLFFVISISGRLLKLANIISFSSFSDVVWPKILSK